MVQSQIRCFAMSTPLLTIGRSFVSLARFVPSWHDLLAIPGIWNRRLQDRHELSMLDDARLRDIGLTRERVAREIAKPFWEA